MAREHAAVVDEADAVPAVDFRRVQPAGGRIHEDVDDEERPVRAKRGGREDVGDVQESEARRAAHIEVEEKEVHDGRVAPRGVALAVAGATAGIAANIDTIGYVGLSHRENQAERLSMIGCKRIIQTMGELDQILYRQGLAA